MTTIQPYYTPYSSPGITGASQLSNNQLLLDTLDASQNQNSADIFGSAYTVSLSNAALNALSGGDAGGNNTSDSGILSLDALLNEFSGSNDLGTPAIQYSAGPVVPTAANGPSFDQAVVADGGPLPAFLAYVDKAMNLDASQQQSLANIATAFENAPGTQQTVDSIAIALQQAGIPETI